MIERSDLLSLNFYKSKPFTGSDGNLRYRVEKIEVPDDSGEDDGATKAMLQATVWPGPFAFAKTADEKKTRHTAAFSEEGMQDLVDWMNRQSIDSPSSTGS